MSKQLIYLLVLTYYTKAFQILPPSLLTNQKSPPLSISDELGTSILFNNTLFDPLNLATDDNFATYREAELKHGRVAMLATVGMALPSLFPNTFVIHDLSLSSSHRLLFEDVPRGSIAAVTAVPWQGWLQIIAFCGFVEAKVLVQRDVNDMPGDYGVGYFGLIDKARHERELLAELENGRLAMVAFLVQVELEIGSGEPVGNLWRDALDILKDIITR